MAALLRRGPWDRDVYLGSLCPVFEIPFMDEDRCPLCRNEGVQETKSDPELQREVWKCVWCGRFELRRRFTNPKTLQDVDRVHILRGLAAERNQRDEPALVIEPANIEELIEQGPTHPVEQAERLLVNLAYKSSEPGMFTALTSFGHRALAFAAATDAFIAWLDFLENEGLIEYGGERKDEHNDLHFRLTLDGWRRVRELRSEGIDSDEAFIAMDFSREFAALWSEGIAPAVRDVGWTPIRADQEEHTDQIDDWILNKIDQAAFVVADTTGSNPGACFEAGYALGQGTPVIWVAREETVHGNGDTEEEGLHFDIRQYNHLTWSEGNEGQLVEPLANRIRQTVGPRNDARNRARTFVE